MTRKDRQEIKTKKRKGRLRGKKEKTRHTPQSGGDAVFEEKTETQEDYFKKGASWRLY